MKKLFFMMALVAFLCSGLLGGTAVTERLPLFGMPKACAFEIMLVSISLKRFLRSHLRILKKVLF